MQAARNGDEAKAAEYVEQAAKEWGAFSDGKPVYFYHGTPNAGYTVFKSGSYFTTNREYADVYQSPSASSISVKRSADNPDTYSVFLKIKKPFDTRNQVERDIFYNEFYKQWGNGTDLMESGLPDWLEGGDLQEFLEENGYDYDCIILDEGGTGGYGEDVKSRGLSYLMLDSSHIKSADPITYDDNGEIIPLSERFSESKDIRYSVKDETLQASAAEHFGSTYNWNETGYRLKNGKRLDFSGKNYGARGGSRTIDHRDIDEVYNDELSGTEAMIDFINRGNIRIMPEVGGVELSAVPTKAQKEALDSFISKYRGKITLDISDENGDNLLSVEYPRGTFSKKILNDIEQYFENGTEPYISDTARFRYSVLDRNDIQKALDKRERQIFYSAINPLTQNDGLRIGENGILIPSEDTADTYKLIHYTNIGSVQVHDVYKLINHDYNIHEIIPDVAKHIIELREEGYNEKHTQSILKSFSSLYGTVFKKYSPKSHRFVNYARSGNRNGTVNRPQPTGTGVFERIRQNGSSAKQLVYDTAIIDTIRDQEAELVQVCRSTRRKPAAETVREPPFWRVALLLFIYLFFLFGGFQKLVAQCCEGGACKRGDNKNPKGCERLCISGNGGDQGGADTSCRVNRSAGKPDTQNMHKGKC